MKISFTKIFVYSFLLFSYTIVYSQSGWIQQNSGTNFDLYSIYFINSNTGYATGYTSYPNNMISIIIRTTNGGLNWITLKQDSLKFLSSIFFIDENTGYVAGDSPYGAPVLKTTNAGFNWNTQIIQINMLYSIYFVNSNTGFIAGKYGVLVTTSNGGINWVIQQISYHDLFFVNFIGNKWMSGDLARRWSA